MPNLSVIVCAYNVEQYITRCIQSLFDQTLDDIEYVIIEDCSTDNTRFILENLIKDALYNIKYIVHTENKGIGFSRQEGLENATGDYIIYCDADDWVDSDYYKELYTYAIDKSENIVVGNYKIISSEYEIIHHIPLFVSWLDFIKYPKGAFLSIWSQVIKRKFIFDNKISFYPGINFSEDYAFLTQCYYYNNGNAFCDTISYYNYNKLNQNSITSNSIIIPKLQNKAECIHILEDFYRSKGYNPYNCMIFLKEVLTLKESYILINDFKAWKETFPKMSMKIFKISNLSLPYQIAWFLGQYINENLFEFYVKHRASHNLQSEKG